MIVPHFDNLQIHLHYSGNNLQKLPYVAYLGFWCTKIMEAKAHLLQPTHRRYKILLAMLTFEVGCPGCLLSVTTCCCCVGRFRRDGCSIAGQRDARWSSNAEQVANRIPCRHVSLSSIRTGFRQRCTYLCSSASRLQDRKPEEHTLMKFGRKCW